MCGERSAIRHHLGQGIGMVEFDGLDYMTENIANKDG